MLSAGSASAGSIEGFYTIGGRTGATIRLARGKEQGCFVGVVVSARSPHHQQQLNQTVLELRQVKDGALRGRCNAYHVHASDDMEAWLEVAEAEVMPGGALRCLVRIPGEGSVQFLYERVEEPPGRQPEATGGGDLAGEWADEAGAIAVYHREGEIYIGQIIRQGAPDQGGAARKETIRVKATANGVYKGTIEFASPNGGKVEQVEDVQVVVRGESLTTLYTTKEGKVSWTARRLASAGEKVLPAPKAALVDPGDLVGKWRAPNGDTTRYTRDGARYTGYIVAIAPDKEGFGFRIGEEGVRLTRISGGFYVGKVLVKTEGGKDSWWEDIEFTVEGDELRYTRYMVNGKLEKGKAARIGGLQDTAPTTPKSP